MNGIDAEVATDRRSTYVGYTVLVLVIVVEQRQRIRFRYPIGQSMPFVKNQVDRPPNPELRCYSTPDIANGSSIFTDR